MPDPTPPTPPPSPPTPPPDAPWHAGIEADTLGFWQNKGYKVDDPKALATDLTKQYRELERHMGAPPDQLLRLPKADAKPEDIKAFWNRLGAPADAKDYDFNGIKFAGEDLDPGFADAMRAGLAAAFVPKDKATSIVQSVVKYLEEAETREATVTNGKLAEEKAALAKDWGQNFDYNHLKAMEGARRLGITPEAVKAMEGQIGYKAVMEAMRKIGAGTSEDTFVERGTTGQGNPTTAAGAQARLNDLMADQAWAKRLTTGDTAARQEWFTLLQMIEGPAA